MILVLLFRRLFHSCSSGCKPFYSIFCFFPLNSTLSSCGENHLRAAWRISLGLGVIPALAVFIWRLRMEEPTRFKRDSMLRTRIPYWLVLKRYWVGLTGISVAWFLYDFIVYPVGSLPNNDILLLQLMPVCSSGYTVRLLLTGT